MHKKNVGADGEDFFTGQRAAAAFDHAHLRVDFVGAVYVERHLIDGVEIKARDAEFAQTLLAVRRTGHRGVEHMLVLAQRRDEKIDGGAGADADDAVEFQRRQYALQRHVGGLAFECVGVRVHHGLTR